MDTHYSRREIDLGDETFPSVPSTGHSPGQSPDEEAQMPAPYSIVKVFSATKSRDREQLGERVTAWLAANPTLDVVRTSVTQTSDHGFHCLTIVLFCAAPR